MSKLTLRYDDYDPDAVLTATIERADADGVSIDPPLLRLTDQMTGDPIFLSREQARKLGALIARM